jgi:hypothetical protein
MNRKEAFRKKQVFSFVACKKVALEMNKWGGINTSHTLQNQKRGGLIRFVYGTEKQVKK